MSQRSFVVTLIVVVLAGGAWLAYSVLGRSRSEDVPAPPPPLSAAQAALEGGRELGVAKGNPQAPLVIQEFADYQCPACATFAALTARGIDEQYVKTGKVHWIFYDFPLTNIHPNALPAAQAARCAGAQGNFWGMHDLLFARQREWAGERNPIARFKEYARALRLDADALATCVESGQFRDIVLQSQARAERLGVQSTPTFYIGRRAVSGAFPYDEFAAWIEQSLAAANAP